MPSVTIDAGVLAAPPVDGSAEEALAQINSKGYAIPYQADHRKVIKIGVNFDSATRTIGDWKIAEEA